jgi:hypothetical protein
VTAVLYGRKQGVSLSKPLAELGREGTWTRVLHALALLKRRR